MMRFLILPIILHYSYLSEGFQEMKKYRLFIGNPGVGKSTLVNCLAKKIVFKSGRSIGGGLTFKLDKEFHNGITYMDTPGLATVKQRKEAAEAITQALKQDGSYQIFFVVTLESGRVRPQDLATMRLVLENAKDITEFSLIVNKVTNRLYKDLRKNKTKLKLLISQLNFKESANTKPPGVLLVLRDDDLDDADEVYTHVEGLEDFVNNAPSVVVHPKNVNDIPGDDTFEKVVDKLGEQLNELRSDNTKLKKLMEVIEGRYAEVENKLRKKSQFKLLDLIPVFGPIIRHYTDDL